MARKDVNNTNDFHRKNGRKKSENSWKLFLFYILGALIGIGVYMLQNM